MNTTLQKTNTETPARTERQEYLLPEVNIYETRDGYLLEAEMPGVNKDGLEVLLEGHELTIVGHRRQPPVEGEVIFRESHTADFRRVFELDPAIDTGRIAAAMTQGVLTLNLPKSERVKPRKITVTE